MSSSTPAKLTKFFQKTSSHRGDSVDDKPNRLSGWFRHTFSSSDLSALLAHQPQKSAKNPFLVAAKHGKGHLDKAMRYLLDSDAVPDKSTQPIWLLGVRHPGYQPPPPPPHPIVSDKKRRSSASPPVSFRPSSSDSSSTTLYPDSSPLSQSTSSLAVSTKFDPSAHWPPAFYQDFTSRIWLTYRSQFPIPIRDIRLADLTLSDHPLCDPQPSCPPPASLAASTSSSSSTGKRSWPWGGDKTWSTDAGWGCMLRTAQSLLANTLVHVHLGRGQFQLFLSLFVAQLCVF